MSCVYYLYNLPGGGIGVNMYAGPDVQDGVYMYDSDHAYGKWTDYRHAWDVEGGATEQSRMEAAGYHRVKRCQILRLFRERGIELDVPR